MPLVSAATFTDAAELLQLPPTGTVASSLITRAVGTAGVSVLVARSALADNASRPFGVTGQEQQETICSSGVKAYTFAQMAPVVAAGLAVFCDARPAPRVPALVRSRNESPEARFAT